MILFDRVDALLNPLEQRLESFYTRVLTDSARSLASLLRAKSALNQALFRASELAYSEALYSDLLRKSGLHIMRCRLWSWLNDHLRQN